MNKLQEKFQELLRQKGDKALLDVRYMGIDYDDIIKAYLSLNMKPPVVIIPNTRNIFSDNGWGNGYVRIPEGHEYYEKTYDDIPVNVHGGLTFGDHVFGKDKYFSDGYWVGFDTAHYGDDRQRWPMDKVLDETIHLFKEIYGLN
jgi:hypothetical protein